MHLLLTLFNMPVYQSAVLWIVVLNLNELKTWDCKTYFICDINNVWWAIFESILKSILSFEWMVNYFSFFENYKQPSYQRVTHNERTNEYIKRKPSLEVTD